MNAESPDLILGQGFLFRKTSGSLSRSLIVNDIGESGRLRLYEKNEEAVSISRRPLHLNLKYIQATVITCSLLEWRVRSCP